MPRFDTRVKASGDSIHVNPWGLLFGAFAVGGAVMDYKKTIGVILLCNVGNY